MEKIKELWAIVKEGQRAAFGPNALSVTLAELVTTGLWVVAFIVAWKMTLLWSFIMTAIVIGLTLLNYKAVVKEVEERFAAGLSIAGPTYYRNLIPGLILSSLGNAAILMGWV